jgi:hypothetical protein
MLSEGAVEYIKQLPQVFYPLTRGSGDYRKKVEIIDALILGIENLTVQRMTHHSLTAKHFSSYRVHPYGIVYSRGFLYLVGHSEKNRECSTMEGGPGFEHHSDKRKLEKNSGWKLPRWGGGMGKKSGYPRRCG